MFYWFPRNFSAVAALLWSLCATADAPSASEPPARFDVWEFRVEGNSVLERQTVERTVYPFLGPNKSIEDVEQARQALQKVYQDAGYGTVLVDIPEQGVEKGEVVLQVTEGSIDRFKVTGSRYFLPAKIKEKVPALAEGTVPHLPTLQKQLAEVGGESPDRTVTPVLRAGKTPGKLEAELQVKDELPLHGSLEMNSRNAAGTTRTRLAASLRYDNLWQAMHSAQLQYQVAPENIDEVEVWSGTYAMPTGFRDSRLAFYAIGVSSNTSVASAGALNVIGDTNTYGASLSLPLGGTGGFFQTVSAGFQYRESGQAINLLGGDSNNTPVDYSAFQVGYSVSHRGDSRMSSLDLGLHFSVRGLGNDAQEFSDRRSGARPNYMYLLGEIHHQEILPYDLRLLFRLSGQVADSPLISPEQFSVGGPGSVRGYHQTQALADNGFSGSLELYSPKIWDDEAIDELRALVFVEGGKLWVIDPLPQSPRDYRLASFGAGLRAKIFRHYIGELDWGYPIFGINDIAAGEQRVDFRVAYEF